MERTYITEYWNVGDGETGNSELIPEYVTHIKDLPFPEKVDNLDLCMTLYQNAVKTANASTVSII